MGLMGLEGMMYWKMLENNAMVNKQLYIAQLHRENGDIRLKRPDRHGQTILLHDNASPPVKAALQELEYDVLQLPPYSLDLAPTDYHLFLSPSNYVKSVTYVNKEILKN